MESNQKISVGIITYHKAYNYGSALQAYALNKFLRQNGFAAETIDYRPISQRRIYKLFEPIHSFMSICRNLHSLRHLVAGITKKRRFDRFLSEHVPMSRTFYKKDDLFHNPPVFNRYICGSDQIWNQNCYDFDTSYLLDFVSDKRKCLAYAASTGGAPVSPEHLLNLKQFVSEYPAISMREPAGGKVVQAATGCDCATVLDPVALLGRDEWETVRNSESSPKAPYIFCYFISPRTQMRSYAKQLSRKTGLPLVVVNRSLRDIGLNARCRYDAGPEEWLDLLKNAEYICSDSFHAMMFSIIFEKRFWIFVSSKQDRDSNLRVRNLASLCNLDDRLLCEDTCSDDYALPVNYDFARRTFAEERNRSATWLLKHLRGEA